MSNWMPDLETLDTAVTAAIISIGAVKFDLVSGKIQDDAFYASISIESNLQAGRTINEDTLMWWMNQSEEARRVFYEPKIPLDSALDQLREWVGKDWEKLSPWGNGPTFDLSKLTHAYAQRGEKAPWIYWNERCVRTYRALPGAKAFPKVVPVIPHHGMYDAMAQAEHMIQIHKGLFGPEVRKIPMAKVAK